MKLKTILHLLLVLFFLTISSAYAEKTKDQSESLKSDKSVIVNYFHGKRRCVTCQKLEAYAKEALETGFADELADKKIQWKVTDMSTPENLHFAEDFNLGRYYNEKGISIDLLMGGEAVKFRMYPDSFAQVFEGWTKNFSTGSFSSKLWILLMIILWVAGLTAALIEIVRATAATNTLQLIILAGIYLFSAGFIYRAARAAGSYPLYVCLLYPIYLLAFHVIFICSVIATFFTKSTTWKGRKL